MPGGVRVLVTGLGGPGAHTPPQTPLLFRGRSRGTLGQTPADKVRWGDGLNTQREFPRFSFSHVSGKKSQAFQRN